MLYQHDGLFARYNANARQLLDAMPRRVACSVTPYDAIRILLVGAIKASVYETPVDSEEDLFAWIVATAGDIAEIVNVFEYVRHSLCKRYERYVEVHGDHFE